MDERLTYSGRFTHISGHSSAVGREQDRERNQHDFLHSLKSLTRTVRDGGEVPDLGLETLDGQRVVLYWCVGVDVVAGETLVVDDRSEQLIVSAWCYEVSSRYRRTQYRCHQHTVPQPQSVILAVVLAH